MRVTDSDWGWELECGWKAGDEYPLGFGVSCWVERVCMCVAWHGEWCVLAVGASPHVTKLRDKHVAGLNSPVWLCLGSE